VADRAPASWLDARSGDRRVALETTLLAHGVPASEGAALARTLADEIRRAGASPAIVGLLDGRAVVGMTEDELGNLLGADPVKTNASNLGVVLAHRRAGATTVSATMDIAARAGVRIFATGGIGGVHRGFHLHPDISSDLGALARWPVAVVASGVKSILDVPATREALETLGVPCVGWRTSAFPAFYRRESDAHALDARFDDLDDLASYLDLELSRAGRGVLVANPIPEAEEIRQEDWSRWLASAERRAHEAGAVGRDATPALLSALHEVSGGATLRANIALVRSNARLAGELAARLPERSA